MSSAYGDRKLAALKQKFGSIREEFACWRLRSKRGGPFEKHNSQIRRIQSRLRPFCRGIRADLEGATPDLALAKGLAMEQRILAAHRIWEYFRAKLSQREGRLSRFLKAADEFAWACYKPARTRAVPDPGDADRKEPPLVFFNGSISPFASPRDSGFRAEEVPNEPLGRQVLEEILEELPVPVVGVPWTLMGHVADALSIGHEVGHLVARDFRLGDALQDAPGRAAIPSPRLGAWKSWMTEVFADVYGCLATGPAFVASLIDYLAADAAKIRRETRVSPGWGRYPTTTLRVLLNLSVLRVTGFATEAEKLGNSWETSFEADKMTDFVDDLVPLVDVLLKGPYPTMGGCALTDVLRFTADQQGVVAATVRQVKEGSRILSSDVRVLFASIRGLFEVAPATSPRLVNRLLDHIQQKSEAGVRNVDVAWSLTPNHPTTRALQIGDRERGVRMLEALDAELSSDPFA